MHRIFTSGKPLVYLALALTFLIASTQSSQATHAMGADLQYTCLGGDTYLIRLVIYRDCAGINLNSSQNITIGSGFCGVSSYTENLPRVSLLELTPICPAQQPNSSCQGGPLPGVEEHIYEKTVTLQDDCPDWNLSWRLCCRNYAITNSVITTQTRMYIEATLNNLDVTCNNSPYFTSLPVPFLCDGEPFQFNNGSVDPDGDSLAFELVDPSDYQSGQPTPVPYLPGFNKNYPVTTSPPNSFNFDPNSAQFSFTPSGFQQGIVTLLVKEYRNGQLIGTTMRDLQLVVITCQNQSPDVGPPYNVSGGQLNGNTFSVCLGNTLSFQIQATDPNLGDSIFVNSTLGQAIPGANFTTNGVNPLTGTFSWTPTAADIGNHFFSLTFQDNGCPLRGQQVVGFNIIVQNGEVLPPQEIPICGDTLQNVQLNASTTGPGTYTWTPATALSNPNIPNPVASVSGPASYTVTYTEPGECPIVEPVEIISEGIISLEEDSFAICLGGSVQLDVDFTQTGPQVPFVFTWDPPFGLSDPNVANPIASPTVSTNYTVTVTTLSCLFTESVYVRVDSQPQITLPPDVGICAGDSILLQATGSQLSGTTLQWTPTNGLANPNAIATQASPSSNIQYSLTATNACGTAQADIGVTVFAPLQALAGITDPSCVGSTNGSVNVTTIGGGGNPSYNWIPSVGVGNTATNLGAGSYSVVVTDISNCVDTVTAVLTDPPPLVAGVANAVDITCFGDFTGQIVASATGGTPPYEYSIDGINFQDTTLFEGLAAGTYFLTVQDDNGCQALDTVTLVEPGLPLSGAVLNVVNTDCNTALGEIEVQGLGGTPPYQYALNNGPFSTDSSFTGLFPGTYLVRIQDANGCGDTLSVAVFDIQDPYGIIGSIQDVSCFGGSDGSVSIVGFAGTPPYEFNINNGPYGPNSTFTGLSAGFYTVTLRDSIGCIYTLATDILEPDSLILYVNKKSQPSCTGSADGELGVFASGGVKPYSYSIDGQNFVGSSNFTGLGTGIYTLYVRDANGCETSINAILEAPPQLIGLVAGIQDVDCFGNFTGSVSLSASGGTPPYLFSPDSVVFVPDSSFDRLMARNYRFFVQDANGCTEAIDFTINQPDPVVAGIGNISEVDCNGGASGSFSVTAAGGTPPYSFGFGYTGTPGQDSIFTGLDAGTYPVVVLDTNNCRAETQATIAEPPPYLVDIMATDVTCFGDSNGTAQVTASGASPPYSYSWSNGQTGSFANNLPSGNVWVIVTDANGCEIPLSAEVLEPPRFFWDTLTYENVTCFGANDGRASAQVDGGNRPYVIDWPGFGNGDSVNNLPAGMIPVVAFDSNGCRIDTMLELTEPPKMEMVLVDSKDSYCERPNGFLLVDVQNPQGDVTYQWSANAGQTGPMATDLLGSDQAGSYIAVGTDSAGCTVSDTFEVGSSPVPNASFYTSLGQVDSAILPVDGVYFYNTSTNAFNYLWDFGVPNGISDEENPWWLYKEPGTFDVTLVAYDSLAECPDTARLRIILFPPGVIFIANAFTPNGDGQNDFFYPFSVGVVELELIIFDRWGVEITRLTSTEERWNGKHPNGKDVQEGVYVYKLNALLNDGSRYEKAGTVTLFR